MTKRLLTFALLGPVLGCIAGKYGLPPPIGGEVPAFDFHGIVLLPVPAARRPRP